jgi:hypothetical protein
MATPERSRVPTVGPLAEQIRVIAEALRSLEIPARRTAMDGSSKQRVGRPKAIVQTGLLSKADRLE